VKDTELILEVGNHFSNIVECKDKILRSIMWYKKRLGIKS
jgi:hypothetical protein